MKLNKPFVGIIAFTIVLLTMPLGHAVMILMEHLLGSSHLFLAAGIMGFTGVALVVWGSVSGKEIISTFLGLFGGLFIWTGWIEFAFVYFADTNGVQPLLQNGEIVTKPEYLIMPSSVGFWAVFMVYYLFNSRTGCTFFSWLQQKLKIRNVVKYQHITRNNALTTMMELILILWTFYLLLLFAYDENFFGDKHPFTYLVAFGSLLWSGWLMLKLLKINTLSYAIKYSIPTVIIFWNFVEILGRWEIFREVWVEPTKYTLEVSIIFVVMLALIGFVFLDKRRKTA